MRLIFLLPLLSLACSKSKGDQTDTGPIPDTDRDTNDTKHTGDTSANDTDTAPPDNFSPRIVSCDATCEFHDVGDTYWKWSLGCNVNDPDGLDNIWNGSSIVSLGSTQITEYLVACNTQGLCTTGFREDTDNILCSQAASYQFVTRIKDWEGNTSKPNIVNGRQK